MTWKRSELAIAIRKAPQVCNALIAGYEKNEYAPALYWIDYLGTLVKTNKAAHGYAGYFLYGLLDNFYKPVALFFFFFCYKIN